MNVLKAVEEHVYNLFQTQGQVSMLYHNYGHTADVAAATEELAIGVGLSEEDKELVMIAAWFHDTGYIETYDGHEEESVRLATNFLNSIDFDKNKLEVVTSAILATRFPQKPQNQLEKVLCDADFAHLGKRGYLKTSKALRLEWELMGQGRNDDWIAGDIQFLSNHKYHTEFARQKYFKRKQKNIEVLRKLEQEFMKADKKSKKNKSNEDKPQRGIETLFRVTFQNHMDLSSIADNKANIMLSINAIIISISLSVLVPKFDTIPHLIIPSTLLILVSVGSIIFATLSTRPKISAGRFTREDVQNKKSNLLFFGNFHSMPFDEFEWGMNEMMKSGSFLYGSMIKDIYSLGTVLAKKYKYLRITYNFFMYGMILSVIAFLVTFIIIGS